MARAKSEERMGDLLDDPHLDPFDVLAVRDTPASPAKVTVQAPKSAPGQMCVKSSLATRTAE